MNKKCKILVVDDEPINIRLLIDSLKHKFEEEYDFYVALNGKLALETVLNNPPDLILLDVEMPVMNGFELCEILKNDDTTKHIPIIFITAKTEISEEQQGFKLGAFDYIRKPFNPTIVTARIRTAIRLIEHEQELNKLVDQRTVELQKTNHHLKTEIVVRKKAENAHKAIEEKLISMQKFEGFATMASGIAHDFNNVLLPITCYTEMTLMNVEDEDDKDNLNQVLTAVNVAKKIISQLMMLGKSKSINDVESYVIVDMKEIVSEVYSLLKVQASEKMSFIKDFDENIQYSVLGHQTQLHQVIMNLCKNAIQAMEKLEDSRLTVSFDIIKVVENDTQYIDLKEDKYYLISVKDNGLGMDEKTVQKIFDPYFTTKASGKGTGLGLSMVKGIIKKHGGTISLQSEVGKGTQFDVLLPIANAENE